MATRAGRIQIGDVKQGRVFYEVRFAYVLESATSASPQVWPIERLVVTSRPQKYRTPDGYMLRFDTLKECVGRRGKPPAMVEYSPFLSQAIEFSQTGEMEEFGPTLAYFVSSKAAAKFALQFASFPPPARILDQMHERQSRMELDQFSE